MDNTEQQTASCLVNEIKYEENITLLKLEQYKLFVEMADRISSRRLTANSFFLSLNTALVALMGYVVADENNLLFLTSSMAISFSGVVLCYIWYRLIRSYKDLNTAKFIVIHEMESELPFKAYDAEWQAAGEGNNTKKYLPFTHIEMAVPWVFFCLHVFVLMVSIPWCYLMSLMS